MDGRVAWIMVAPVKALGLLSRDEVELTEAGVVDNRAFHLVDERGVMVNGKRFGPLVAVRPVWDGESLALHFPGGETVQGPVELDGLVASNFFGRPRRGHLVRGPFSDALSQFAGRPLQLVKMASVGSGVDRGRNASVSLLSTAACGDYDPRRFRMLFGIDGVPAHAEDDWVGYRIRLGDAVVRPTGHTGRCLITSQDPDTGRPDLDMLQVIRETRPDDTSEPLPFGVHGNVAQPGTVRVGDPVSPV